MYRCGITVDNIVLDTGTADSLFERIDCLKFGTFTIHKLCVCVDLGNLDAHSGVNGLLGFDILSAGQFVIDLDEMEVYQKE